eukprot:CAMPEP_0204415388 /NCGR_PEP_ID=MMETSP0470-20130426/23655_1 /ASSEMBLY_ACC=CAM_ASM_000385 /TAXON_ID=2969 /ORGANISM="Oxyrrhis marina" /LENGTH=234 /DNA_ID=CAMNT_0051411745 /DNA_START=56 /DNA_END=756 /DNA_ORIENTATION=+
MTVVAGGECRVFVGRLGNQLSDEEFKAMFSECAGCEDAYVVKDRATQLSKGCGFLKFGSLADAVAAIQHYHQTLTIQGQNEAIQVRLGDHDSARLGITQQQQEANGESKLYICGLPRTNWSEDATRELVSQYGTVTEVVHINDSEGTFKGSGFVKFATALEALAAIAAVDNQMQVGTSPKLVELRFAEGKGAQQRPLQPGEWHCVSCSNVNFPMRTSCNRCGQPRPANVLMASP